MLASCLSRPAPSHTRTTANYVGELSFLTCTISQKNNSKLCWRVIFPYLHHLIHYQQQIMLTSCLSRPAPSHTVPTANYVGELSFLTCTISHSTNSKLCWRVVFPYLHHLTQDQQQIMLASYLSRPAP